MKYEGESGTQTYAINATVTFGAGADAAFKYKGKDSEAVENILWSLLDFPATTSVVFVVSKEK